MTFGERVLSVTRQYLMPKVVYNVLGGNVMASRLMGNGQKGQGAAVERAIKWKTSGQAISFSHLDPFQPQQMDTRIRLSVEMKAARQGMGISGMDLMANQGGDVRVNDLLTVTLEETMDELFDKVGDYSYSDGAGNSGKDPAGIDYIIDDGSNAPIFQGKARSTYSVLNAQVTSLLGVNGELTMPRLTTLYNSVSIGTGKTTPTLINSGQNEQALYEQLLTPTIRNSYSETGSYIVTRNSNGLVKAGSMQGHMGDGAFTALQFKGVPWTFDTKANEKYSQKIAMLNENYLDWFGWAAEGEVKQMLGYEPVSFKHTQVDSTFAEKPMSDFTGFNWRPWISAQNQFAGISDMIITGNMASWQPRRQGVLKDVDEV